MSGILVEEPDHDFVAFLGAKEVPSIGAGIGRGQSGPDGSGLRVDTGENDLHPQLFVRIRLELVHDPDLKSGNAGEESGGGHVADTVLETKTAGRQTELHIGPPAIDIHPMTESGDQRRTVEAVADACDLDEVEQLAIREAARPNPAPYHRHPAPHHPRVGPCLQLLGRNRYRVREDVGVETDRSGHGSPVEIPL